MTRRVVWLACALLLPPQWASGQTLASLVARAPDGSVRFTFPVREGVCGDGPNVQFRNRGTRDWAPSCDDGPARVVLRKRAGAIADVDTYIGGRWREGGADATDLGHVTAGEAARYLLDLAATSPAPASRDAILPAMIADTAGVWGRLVSIARDGGLPRSTRRQAMHWLAVEASASLDTAPVGEDPDREAREHAVFALSRLPNDEAVPRLIDIARNHRYAHVRRRALFWLGQSGDPRAIDVMEEVLRR